MLKQLELVGFKSFAERTTFSFVSGITAIVGPNGSGKSNVVDAVRWMLGEQSAKTLRGGEMADVIFNGSSSRKGLSMAEVSMTLDNEKRLYNFDAEEIVITRRVYRDGTGEYLLNRQLSRLKDIKDVFLGSGAGTNGYSIMAQGKVDAILQASNSDRRMLFDEAAGISRFRAKKIETLKKLEQTEANLQRVRDISEEMERQLQAIRLQASKAQKYKELSEEFKALRMQLALREYYDFSQTLSQVEEQRNKAKLLLEEHASRASADQVTLAELEQTVHAKEVDRQENETKQADLKAKIAKLESTIQHEEEKHLQLLSDQANSEGKRCQLLSLVTDFETRFATASKLLGEQQNEVDSKRHRLEEVSQQLAAFEKEITQCKAAMNKGNADFLERMRELGHAQNDHSTLKARIEGHRQALERLNQKHSKTQSDLETVDAELKSLLSSEATQAAELQKKREEERQLSAAKLESEHLLAALSAHHSALEIKSTSISSRVQVLSDLEASREGLGAGVRQVLDWAGSTEPGPWSNVIGLVADLLTVETEQAALVDAALGELSQAIVVRDEKALEHALAEIPTPLASRVSFISLNALRRFTERIQSDSLSKFLSCNHSDLEMLPAFLLGSLQLVELLPHSELIVPGQGFITRKGDLLTAKGLRTTGQNRIETAVLSRKSELRDLRSQKSELDSEMESVVAEIRAMEQEAQKQAERHTLVTQSIHAMNEQLLDLKSRVDKHRSRSESLLDAVEYSRYEMKSLEDEITQYTDEANKVLERCIAAEQAVQELKDRLASHSSTLSDLETKRQQSQEAETQARVELVQSEGAMRKLTSDSQQCRFQLEEKQSDLQQFLQHIGQIVAAIAHCLNSSRTAQNKLQEARNLSDELCQAHLVIDQHIQHQRSEIQRLREKGQTLQAEWQNLIDQIHREELRLSETRQQKETLVARIQEEQEVDLVAVFSDYQPPETPLDVKVSQDRLAELRRKIARLGNVNLESLEELAQLESRFGDQRKQLTDLAEAKASLDQILERINEDSRKLFSETFSAVRSHFQELFRKLFGGGMADIVLENPNDILESGVDIVACPPGKEMRSIALLSGGEKTMTAVALLLAIFKNKPSPFCIMDEVDAALDEANVGRFAAVVREFVGLSQFILITHIKKTMTAADVLYGVTMQEAGVSKRIAVRLDDASTNSLKLAA